MRSFAFASPVMPGTGTDNYVVIEQKAIGSGRIPERPFTFAGADLAVWTTDPQAYAVLGATLKEVEGDRDYVSLKTIGRESRLLLLPADLRFTFDPAKESLHLHWQCAKDFWIQLYLTVFFTC